MYSVFNPSSPTDPYKQRTSFSGRGMGSFPTASLQPTFGQTGRQMGGIISTETPSQAFDRAAMTRGSGLRGAPTPRDTGMGGFAAPRSSGFARDFDFAREADQRQAMKGLMGALGSGEGLTRQQARAFDAFTGMMNLGLQQQKVGNDAAYQQGNLANDAANSLRDDQNAADQNQVTWMQKMADWRNKWLKSDNDTYGGQTFGSWNR